MFVKVTLSFLCGVLFMFGIFQILVFPPVLEMRDEAFNYLDLVGVHREEFCTASSLDKAWELMEVRYNEAKEKGGSYE